MKNEVWVANITHRDGEVWYADIEGTKEEVIKLGVEFAKKEGYTEFDIGQKIPVGVPTINSDYLIEQLQEQFYNDVGEAGDGFLEEVDSEQQKELEDKMNEVFQEWVAKYNLEVDCYHVINTELIEVKDYE